MTFEASRSMLKETQLEGLTVAMILAPGVYARNRMFELLSSSGARRARVRAGVVRGMVSQLAHASSVNVATEPRGNETVFVLRYFVSAVRLTRVVELTAAELAALRILAERANVRTLPSTPADREVVASALARLMEATASGDSARLAHAIVTQDR